MSQVKISSDRGRLRLRWRYQNRDFALYLDLEDSYYNRAIAQHTVSTIETDIKLDQFDWSLSKYKRHSKTGKSYGGISCDELFEDWIDFKRIHCSERTIEYLRSGALRKASKFFSNTPIERITKRDCRNFYLYLAESNNKSYTIKRQIQSLQSCWQWAIENDYLPGSNNPWQGIANQVKSDPKTEIKPFTTTEIEKIYAEFASHPHHYVYLPFLKFLFGTGCRVGEAVGLKWQDLCPEFKTCHIRRQRSKGRVIEQTKTGNDRSFTLTTTLSQILEQLYYETAPVPEEKIDRDNSDVNEYVFIVNNAPINDNAFSANIWRKRLEKAGVDYRKLYNTRHTFISHCLTQGMNPILVAQITGHDLKTMYAHYAGFIKEDPQVPELY